MKFYPPRLAYKKNYDKPYSNLEVSNLNTTLTFGDYGIMLTEKIYLRPKQVQTVLFEIRKKLKGVGEVRFKPFPLRCITKKGLGMRMGRGKGAPGDWFFCGRAGVLFLEVACFYSVEKFIVEVFLSLKPLFRHKIRLLVSYDACAGVKHTFLKKSRVIV